MVDTNVRELGKDAEHVAADEPLEIARRPIGVGLAAAEQEPMVGGAPEVVDHELGRVDARTAPHEGAGTLLPQGSVAS